MPYLPPDAKWYLAENVMQFDVEQEGAPLVHINTKLIRATSPEDAYEKACRLGRAEEAEYTNTDGMRVRVRFRGLRDLFMVPGELEDGVELLYEEKTCMNEPDILALAKAKSDLAVFRQDP